MGLVVELGADALHVVVVHKLVEPDMRRHHAIGALDRMGDLEVVVVVVPTVEALVQGVVGHAVERALVRPTRVVAVNDLAHQPEVGLERIDGLAQGLHEVKVEHVGRVETDAIYVKLADPEANDVADVVAHGRVALVELGEQVVASPVVVGEAIVVLVVAPKVHVAVPVAVGRVLAVGPHVLEGKEITSGVVEDAVKDDLEAGLVASAHKGDEVIVGAQARVEQLVVGGFVAMSHRLEERANIESGKAQALEVVNPRKEGIEAMDRFAVVVLLGRSGEAEGINVVKDCLVIPCHVRLPASWWFPAPAGRANAL